MRSVTAMLCLVGLTAGASQANLIRSFDASADPAGDDAWQNTANAGAVQDFRFGSAAAPGVNLSPAAVSDALAPGITAVYEFGADGPAFGGNWAFFGQAGGGRANNPENTFELIFRLDDTSGTHVLSEIGGGGAGVSFIMDGDNLVWNVNEGGNANATLGIAASGLGAGWHYAVGTFNRTSGTTSFYLNGALVGSLALDATTTGWTGGNEATLGGINTAQVNSVATSVDLTGATDFDGGISLFNYWNEELGAQAISDNFNAVFIPAPGAALALLGAGVVGRRRRR